MTVRTGGSPRLRIGLLVCDHVDERFLDAAGGDYPEMFERMVVDADSAAEVLPYDAAAGALPGSPAECDAWMVTGSRASAYDDDPWIRALEGFVRDVHEAQVPLVGVCFGHQLVAQALGGRVERAASGWGVGARTMQLAAGDPWTELTAQRARLLFMHQDQVVALPTGGEVAAEAEHCPVAAMRVGTTTFGLQPHPEFSRAYEDALLDDRAELIGAELVAQARATLEAPLDDAATARWIVRFLRGA